MYGWWLISKDKVGSFKPCSDSEDKAIEFNVFIKHAEAVLEIEGELPKASWGSKLDYKQCKRRVENPEWKP